MEKACAIDTKVNYRVREETRIRDLENRSDIEPQKVSLDQV